MQCKKFSERSCPRFIAKELAKLQISCIYQSNDCNEVVPYEALDKHETHCDHQPQQCSGCQLQMLKSDLSEHEIHCSLIELTCADCKIVYKRCDATILHTDVICLKEQLRQSQEKNQQLNEKIKRNSQEHERELKKFRHDCEDRILQLTGMRTLWPRSFPNIRINATWTQNALTIAGGQGEGSSLNQLSRPFGLYVDDDQTLFIADWGNDRILEWTYGATSGQVVAGGNGRGNRIDQLCHPTGVIVDKDTDSLIICDMENRRVMRWSRRNATNQETILDNIDCAEVVMDDEKSLYVSDCQKNEVRRYQLGDTQGTVVAGGNGKGNHLNQLYFPTYLFVDRDQSVYVSDTYNHRVMKWVKGATEGIVVAGGRESGADWTQLSSPNAIVVDQLDRIYVADLGNHRVVRWGNGVIQIAGGNDVGTQANQLNSPSGLSFDRYGNLYVIDHNNHRVQRFDIEPN
ncbi:unnamed protein product [Rotaria sp. Silwood2]|nr:unnamed protein product [Rotaria sp. Silwood2]